ncbi:hypothetical protein EKG37_10780 [Robertmurraya yapensis]|uniref:Uncharacterized protein n=1 Tax=Bacillus yapensis TaxID=2492960 RepID=A0A3S0LC69_9BACI|nr:hypothetical protein EKG37_10780 [Bacillus yapensis]TKS95987.1 hypothetical protein FAR12_10780 [Bacillus yapensis]
MYRKNCEKCNRPSFGSSEFGKWFCPLCGNDLTERPFFDANTLERIHVKTFPRKRILQNYQKI